MENLFRDGVILPVRPLSVLGHDIATRKLRGQYQYYGINDNWPSLIKFHEAAKRLAYRWICRRSQTGRVNLRDYGGCVTVSLGEMVSSH